jgi:two-component system, chemotaxis family, chemotaxis protein CheY
MTKQAKEVLETVVVLVVDGNAFTRRLLKQMLAHIGVKTIHESVDGAAAIEAIQAMNPDVMLLDWNTPILDAIEVMRIVRAPGVFPKANLPVIMLSDQGLQSRVTMAARIGAHEILITPISPKILEDRMLGIILKPRPMVQVGEFYIPEPRRPAGIEEMETVAS